MKKALAGICILMIVNSGFSQEGKNGFSFSVEAGLTASNMYGPDVESETFLNGNYDNLYSNDPAGAKFKTGFNAGVLLDYRFSKYVSVGLGAGYIEKGAKINAVSLWNSQTQMYQEVEGDIFWNQNFWILEIPVTFYIPVKENDLYLQAGLFNGFLITSEESGDVSINGESGYRVDRERRANEKDPGYFLGAGYLHPLNSNSGIYVEAIWARSLRSPGADMIPRSQKYYNQSISLNLGYRYKL